MTETFLSRISQRAQADLDVVGERRTLKKGEVVLREGDPSGVVYFVRSGWLKISMHTERGSDLVLALRGAGDLIGEIAALTGMERSATVTALTDCEVRTITLASFHEMLRDQPSTGVAIATELAMRLTEADRARRGIHADDIDRRLARCLIDLLNRQDAPVVEPPVPLEPPLTQKDIAGLVSASRGSLDSALRRMRDAGMVETMRGRIVILDPDALRDLLSTDSLNEAS